MSAAALDALPPKEEGAPAAAPKAASEEELQWRELCTSIARAADEEKAALLEERVRTMPQPSDAARNFVTS